MSAELARHFFKNRRRYLNALLRFRKLGAVGAVGALAFLSVSLAVVGQVESTPEAHITEGSPDRLTLKSEGLYNVCVKYAINEMWLSKDPHARNVASVLYFLDTVRRDCPYCLPTIGLAAVGLTFWTIASFVVLVVRFAERNTDALGNKLVDSVLTAEAPSAHEIGKALVALGDKRLRLLGSASPLSGADLVETSGLAALLEHVPDTHKESAIRELQEQVILLSQRNPSNRK